MLNQPDILARVRSGQIPPGWIVYHAQKGYFIRFIIVGLVFLAIAIVGGVALYSDPNHVFILTSIGDTSTGPLDPDAFDRWRTADIIGIALVALLGVVAMVRFAIDLVQSDRFLLVVTPEGFAINDKSYSYTMIQKITNTVYRGQVTLHLTFQPGINPGKKRISLDGRFGQNRTIAGQIMTAWNRVAQAQPVASTTPPPATR